MDESKVRPDSDMNTHKVNNMEPEDLAVPGRHSTLRNEGNQGVFLLMIMHQ
jgi:hypothetical protein